MLKVLTSEIMDDVTASNVTSLHQSQVATTSSTLHDFTAAAVKVILRGGSLPSVHANLILYVSPIIFLFGMVGNSLTIAVMLRRRYRGSSVRMFMLLLAVFDSVVLLSTMPPDWLAQATGIKVKELHPVVCKLERLIFYTAGDSSVWTLCAFTADRFIAVCWPFAKQNTYLARNTWLVSVVLAAVAALKNLHLLWSRGQQYDKHGNLATNCGYRPNFAYFEAYVRPWIAFVTVSAIPFFTLLICNAMIVRALLASERIRKTHGGGGGSGKSGCSTPTGIGGARTLSGRGAVNSLSTGLNGGVVITGGGSRTSVVAGGAGGGGGKSKRSFLQTTFMCLSVSFAFLIFMVPSIIVYIGKPYWGRKDSFNFAYELARIINKLLVCVNHSISFWLYCLTGLAFRRELAMMLRRRCCCCCKRARGDDGRRRMSENYSQAGVSITMRRMNNNVAANSRYEHRIVVRLADDITMT